MALRWTRSAYADLQRTHAFLEPVNPAAAARSRRVLVQSYELRYELSGGDIYIVRGLHTREDR